MDYEALSKRILGHKIHKFYTLWSCNLKAFELAEKGANEGEIVQAGRASRQKTANGKKWYAPYGGLWFSIILRPALSISYIVRLMQLAGISVYETLKELVAIETSILWPDKIIYKNSIIAITRVDTKCSNNLIEFGIVTTGINLNFKSKILKNVKNAISLYDIVKYKLNENEVLDRFLYHFEMRYQSLEIFHDQINDEWKSLSCLLKKRIEILTKNNEIIKGKVTGLDDFGALIIKTPKSDIERVIAGNILSIK